MDDALVIVVVIYAIPTTSVAYMQPEMFGSAL